MPWFSRKNSFLLYIALVVLYVIAYFYMHRNDDVYKTLKFNVTCVPASEVKSVQNFILTATNEEFGATKTSGRNGNLLRMLFSPMEPEPVIKQEIKMASDGYFYIDSIPAYEYMTLYFETTVEKNTEIKVASFLDFDQPRDTFFYTFCMTEHN